jgi:Beta-lactamase enzyme family
VNDPVDGRAARHAHRSTRLATAVLTLIACAFIMALTAAPLLASDQTDPPASPAASATAGQGLAGGHLPLVAVALADVEVLRGETATLPYRIEGARGGRVHVTIVVSAAGGAVVKTIAVAKAVPSDTDLRASFVCRLAPGAYAWRVHATDAGGRVATIAPAARLTVDAVYPSRADIDRAVAWLKRRAGVTSVAVIDTSGVLHGWHQNDRFVSASVVKAMLLVEYLRTHKTVSSSALATLTPMIEVSDNHAAEAVYHVVGDGGLYALAGAAHMTNFAVHGALFEAQLTTADQARFFYRLPALVPATHRALALYLLSHVASYQSWGIPAVARPLGWQVWFKGGWRGTAIGQLVHQVARLNKGGRTFSVAIFTNGDPSQGYGIETIQGVTARLLAGG